MELPKLQKPDRYIGLYVIDFADHCGIGFTAPEVAQLLESQQFRHCKLYKIHRANPDGTIELRGVPSDIFQLESGLFFYAKDQETASNDFKTLFSLAVGAAPPARAKLHLAQYSDEKYATALIYPAEYEDDFSAWLLNADYKTSGPAEGGIQAVNHYYKNKPNILERRQLVPADQTDSKTGTELLAATKTALVR